jgi:hypothetical protein
VRLAPFFRLPGQVTLRSFHDRQINRNLESVWTPVNVTEQH